MKLIHSRTALMMACGAALAAGIVTFTANPAKADEWDKRTVLTVDTPIQIENTLLQPGQYVLVLLRSDADRHVVQVFNSDQTHLINTIIAVPKERLEPTGHSQFTFYETPAGKARALRAWFYPGDNFGQEFPYPTTLYDVGLASNTTTQTTTTTQAEASTPAQPQTQAQPETQPMTQEQPATEPQNTQPQQEMAQNTPPPAEAAPEPAPNTENNEANRSELPTTASPYPLIGLSGLVLIGLAGALRVKRTA